MMADQRAGLKEFWRAASRADWWVFWMAGTKVQMMADWRVGSRADLWVA